MSKDMKKPKVRDRCASGERTFQAGGRARAEALRQECACDGVRGTAKTKGGGSEVKEEGSRRECSQPVTGQSTYVSKSPSRDTF